LFELLHLLDVVEHESGGSEEDRSCKQLNIEADTEDTIVDLLAHVSESDSVEPGSGAAVDDDLSADEDTSDEEEPSGRDPSESARLPVFHNEKNDADERNRDGEHGSQLHHEKPYWRLHELSRIVETAINKPIGIAAIREESIMTLLGTRARSLDPNGPIWNETAKDVDDKSDDGQH